MNRTAILAGAMTLALGACNAGGTTAVPTTDAEKASLARAIAELTTDDKMIDRMFDSVTAAAMPDLNPICEAAPADRQADCRAGMARAKPVIKEVTAEFMVRAKAMMPALLDESTEIVGRIYTGPELAKMKDFYSSPEGRSIMQKQPDYMAAFMPKLIEKLQPLQIDMATELQRRMIEAMVAPPPEVPPI